MPRQRCARLIAAAAATTETYPMPPYQPSVKLEFKSLIDDAWYSSWLQLEGETLRVMHIPFLDTDEERFPASQFETTATIEEFRNRFRPESVPVEDEKCAEVVEGTVVCAFNKYQKTELKFYDATVDSEMTPTTSGNRTFGKKHNSRTAQDMHLGSSVKRKTDPLGCYFFFRVSNLEKDITPVCIMDFIFQQTNIPSVAIVFPALLSEPFSTGTIFVETKDKFDKLSEFLLNPGHLIISSRGRPWILNAKWNGSIQGRMPKYESQLSKRAGEHFGELKFATSVKKEYVMGMKLRKLHMEFIEHKEGLHNSQETEMKKIAGRFPPQGTT